MKDLYWFKFIIVDWMLGRIQRLQYDTKGAFMDLCSFYWHKRCNYSLDDAYADVDKELVDRLITKNIIRTEKNIIKIDFLDEQFGDCEEISTKRSISGSKGGKQKAANSKQGVASAKQVLASAKQNVAYKKRKEKNREEVPTYIEFKTFALEKKKSVDTSDLKLKYDSWVVNGWKTGNDKPIINWKNTLLNTLPHIKESKGEENKMVW